MQDDLQLTLYLYKKGMTEIFVIPYCIAKRLFIPLDIVVELWDICCSLSLAEEVLWEVVCHTPEEVLIHVAEAVALAWEHEHIKALVVADKSIHNAQSTTRVYILVDVAMNKE